MDSRLKELLPEEVLTLDYKKWRAPTSEEVRLVKELAGKEWTNAKLADLIGVTEAMIVRYQSIYRIKNRISINFSAWHFLLFRLGLRTL